MGARSSTAPEGENGFEPRTNSVIYRSSGVYNSTPPPSCTFSSLQSKDFIKIKEGKEGKDVNCPAKGDKAASQPIASPSSPPPNDKKSRKEILVKATQVVDRLLDTWAEFPSLRQSRRDGKVYSRAVSSVVYSLERHSEEELLEAVITYRQIRSHPSCMLTQKWGIDQFLVPEVLNRFLSKSNPWWHYARMRKAPTQIDEDLDPEFTQHVADKYAKLVQGESCFELKIPSKEYTHFTAVAERAREFAGTTKINALKNPKLVVACLIKGLIWHWQDGEGQQPNKIWPGNLSSDHSWETVLPAYLKENLPDMEHEFDYSRFEGE